MENPVTVLHLTQPLSDNKYYICKQEDHYQLNELVKFFWPFGNIMVTLFQLDLLVDKLKFLKDDVEKVHAYKESTRKGFNACPV
ncbi:hypothetical protein BGX21_008751 [Mortierella sp. AD011]|nr:hypothetical protein BGX20_000663 [Mortierella sp. AD010]KAF9397542.1 hypothetical protein BGX21_008751 [Mortierella sp. AD011]